MSAKLQVGVGRAIITPPIGTILFGYGYEPGRPSESVGDDLTVTAVALSYGDTSAMLLSIDVCIIGTEIFESIRKSVNELTAIPCDNIICSATHTHSGPNMFEKNCGWGEPDLVYVKKIFMTGTISAVKEAIDSMRPALMGVGTTQSDVAINRRQFTREGQIILGQNPWGLIDPIMTVLSFVDSETKKTITNLVHYCAHPTASGCNSEITRDWPGQMVDILERESGCTTAFFNGSIGETGPNLPNGQTTGNYAMAMEIGHKGALLGSLKE